jgi:hypothetical protein
MICKENCQCGCNDVFADNPIDMLKFLAQRFEFAGVGHGVALSYARDIRKVLALQGIEFGSWSKDK